MIVSWYGCTFYVMRLGIWPHVASGVLYTVGVAEIFLVGNVHTQRGTVTRFGVV